MLEETERAGNLKRIYSPEELNLSMVGVEATVFLNGESDESPMISGKINKVVIDGENKSLVIEHQGITKTIEYTNISRVEL